MRKKKDIICFSRLGTNLIGLSDCDKHILYSGGDKNRVSSPVIKRSNSSYTSRRGISCPNEHCFNLRGSTSLKSSYPSFSAESSEIYKEELNLFLTAPKNPYSLNISVFPINKSKDIFTAELSETDPLWRVRAYIIGFLLADGTIYHYKKKSAYIVSSHQHKRDKDILFNINKALGGKITGPDKKNLFRLKRSSKELFNKLKEFGMKERHSVEEIAVKLIPPNFIKMKIDNYSLIRDFFRGFFDGDGTFYGTYEKGDMKFNVVGPKKFLESLYSLILSEISSLSMYITPQLHKVYKTAESEFYLFGKNRIYVKGIGFHNLSLKDLENGTIETKEHSWLKVLHISGSLNCIKFFNWLYCNDDNFNSFEINGIKICGERKFRKALKALGNYRFRKEKLAPNWRDVIYNVIPLLERKYYSTKELMEITNKVLFEELKKQKIDYVYHLNKSDNINVFRWRLKFLELRDNLIGRYLTREGRIRKSYYYSKLNPPKDIPKDFKFNIELIESTGNLKRNVKNLIIYYYLIDNEWKEFNNIRNVLLSSKIFAKSSLRPNTIEIYLLELINVDIIIVDNQEIDFKQQKFLLNISILPKYYKIEIKQILGITPFR